MVTFWNVVLVGILIVIAVTVTAISVHVFTRPYDDGDTP